jgi:hypothetical protein
MQTTLRVKAPGTVAWAGWPFGPLQVTRSELPATEHPHLTRTGGGRTTPRDRQTSANLVPGAIAAT